MILDFNKSYNPPCVFSSFTTCPVPTSQNTLPIKIKAGEKIIMEYHLVVSMNKILYIKLIKLYKPNVEKRIFEI